MMSWYLVEPVDADWSGWVGSESEEHFEREFECKKWLQTNQQMLVFIIQSHVIKVLQIHGKEDTIKGM